MSCPPSGVQVLAAVRSSDKETSCQGVKEIIILRQSEKRLVVVKQYEKVLIIFDQSGKGPAVLHK
jgi:hypothetical protein